MIMNKKQKKTIEWLSLQLAENWSQFTQQLLRSKNQLSTKNIHQVRVTSQRLEAILRLIKVLKLNKTSQSSLRPLIKNIKTVRKSLGPLRDLQVESITLKGLLGKGSSPHSELAKELNTKIVGAESQAKLALKKGVRFTKEYHAKAYSKLSFELKRLESEKSPGEIREPLKNHLRKLVQSFNKSLSSIDPKQAAEIHQLRLQAKKLRYRGECLNSFSGKRVIDLSHLKKLQSIAGDIQNDRVLLKTLAEFPKSKDSELNAKLARLRQKTSENQKELMTKDFAKIGTLPWQE